MSEEGSAFIAGVILGFIVGATLVGNIVSCADITEWQATAIEHNAAHYDTKTGEFKWNDDKEPTR